MSQLNLEAYYRARPDVLTYIRDARKEGIDTGTDYEKQYGRSTKGWEQGWLNEANRKYGRNEKDIANYSENELARLHFKNWGSKEGTVESDAYKKALEGLSENRRRLGALQGDDTIDEDTRKQLTAELYQAEYGPKFDMDEFSGLLGKLESSKMKQQRQKSVEGRRDIEAGGLANMMRNF